MSGLSLMADSFGLAGIEKIATGKKPHHHMFSYPSKHYLSTHKTWLITLIRSLESTVLLTISSEIRATLRPRL